MGTPGDFSECWIHNELEESKGAYKVCFECGHVFMTKKSLMEMCRRLWKQNPEMDVIYSCPLCCHDF